MLKHDHPFRRSLGDAILAWAAPTLYHELYKAADDEGCDLAMTIVRQPADPTWRRFLGLTDDNLAFGRRATQSSNSEWSLRPDDAQGAVVGPPTGDFAFHTAYEDRPWWMVDGGWWMVDLGAIHPVSQVRIFNRLDIPFRTNGLEVYVSRDGRNWDLAGCHLGDTPFGGFDSYPLDIDVERAIRFVRVELPCKGILHLDQVQVLRSHPPADA